MAKKGNPNFGINNKHKFQRKGEEVFDAQLKARVHSNTKSKVVEIAKRKKCSVPDVIREALDRYLESDGQIIA